MKRAAALAGLALDAGRRMCQGGRVSPKNLGKSSAFPVALAEVNAPPNHSTLTRDSRVQLDCLPQRVLIS